MLKQNRLFVNLTTEPFIDFEKRGKKYEVRAYGRNGFTEVNIYTGRRVELRKAWNRGSLWGNVGKVLVGSIDDIFDSLGDYKLAEPRASSKEEAILDDKAMLKNPNKYIVFEVLLDSVK
jgi:hypothetical protein